MNVGLRKMNVGLRKMRAQKWAHLAYNSLRQAQEPPRADSVSDSLDLRRGSDHLITLKKMLDLIRVLGNRSCR